MLNINEAKRAYLYRLILAVIALGVLYGVIKGGDVPVVLEVLLALLGITGTGLAAKNTSTDPTAPKTMSGAEPIGDVVVTSLNGKTLYSLELRTDPTLFENQDQLVFNFKKQE